jgi:hypothetical protein
LLTGITGEPTGWPEPPTLWITHMSLREAGGSNAGWGRTTGAVGRLAIRLEAGLSFGAGSLK